MKASAHEYDNRRLAAGGALALVVAGWGILLALSPHMMSRGNEAFIFGAIFGTVFGQVVLAAAWSVYGPGPFIVRLPFALAWCFVLTVLLSLPMLAEQEAMILVIYGALLGGMWLSVQVPLWGMTLGCGLRLRYQSPGASSACSLSEAQFGIRQLMIFTAIVAVILGVGRALMPTELHTNVDRGTFWVIGVLIASQTVKFVPLVLSLLLRRVPWLAVTFSLMFIGFVTLFEGQILALITGRNGMPSFLGFAALSAVASVWVIALGVLVRWAGYSFGATEEPT